MRHRYKPTLERKSLILYIISLLKKDVSIPTLSAYGEHIIQERMLELERELNVHYYKQVKIKETETETVWEKVEIPDGELG